MTGVLKKDDNGYPVMGGVSSSDANAVLNSKIDPITGRLLVDTGGGGGGTPGGSDTDVQWNNAGSFGGDSNFTYLRSGDNRDVFIGPNDFSSAVIQLAMHPDDHVTGESSIYIADNNEAASVTINARDGYTYIFIDDSNVTGSNGKFFAGASQNNSITDTIVSVQATASNEAGILDFRQITTTEKVFTFPNQTGIVVATPDPGANTIYVWDDTDGVPVNATIGSGLTYTHATHTLSTSGGGGGSAFAWFIS